MDKHFSPQEREWVSQMRFAGAMPQEIVDRLGRSKGTISREIKRNSEKRGDTAQPSRREKRQTRRSCRRLAKKIDRAKTKDFILKGLVQCWSPEQIAGRIVATKPKGVQPLSPQTIYCWS